jgi:hypothetical protein
MFIKFDVFGKRLSVQRKNDQWLVFADSGTGLLTRVHEIAIPADLSESELAGYLDDIFHENASDQYPVVVKLS